MALSHRLAACVVMLLAPLSQAQVSVERTWAAFEAVRRDDAEALRVAPKGSIDFEAPDQHGATLLDIAVGRGNPTVVGALLDAGAPAEAAVYGPGKRPAISSALARRHTAIVEVLLAHGAKIDYKDSLGYDAWSIAFGQHDAKYDATRDRRLVDLLNKAMLDRGQQNSRVAGKGVRLVDAALLAAASAGDQDWSARFLDEGADPNALGETGGTPLHGAIFKKNENLVKYLLSRGANPLACPKCESGELLSLACGWDADGRILQLLISSSPQVAAIARRGGEKAPLGSALVLGNSTVIETLLRAGAKPEELGSGAKALDIAVEAGNPSAVEILIRLGFRSGPMQKDPSATHLDWARARAARDQAIEFRRIVELLEAAPVLAK